MAASAAKAATGTPSSPAAPPLAPEAPSAPAPPMPAGTEPQEALLAAKAELRARMRRALVALPPAQRALEEELVTAAVQEDPAWKAARTVALYRSKAPEFSLVGLTLAAWRAGKATAFPRTLEGSRLEFRLVRSWADLEPGRHGLDEPRTDCPLVVPGDLDVAVIPGVAFDRQGHRLGRGGGYYDRFLAGFAKPAWGVAFDVQVVDAVPRGEHDRVLARVWHSAAVVPVGT